MIFYVSTSNGSNWYSYVLKDTGEEELVNMSKGIIKFNNKRTGSALVFAILLFLFTMVVISGINFFFFQFEQRVKGTIDLKSNSKITSINYAYLYKCL